MHLATAWLPSQGPGTSVAERQLGLLSAHEHGLPEQYIDLLESVRQFQGKILAECGGLIYLAKGLVGLVDGTIKMTQKLQACGYREVAFNRDTLLGPKGTLCVATNFTGLTGWTSPPTATAYCRPGSVLGATQIAAYWPPTFIFTSIPTQML